MSGIVYAKTDKGRDEIATRRFGLPARQRALLLLIDGERSLAALVRQFGAAGATEDNVAVLLHGEFIAPVPKAVVQVARPNPLPERPHPQQAVSESQEPVSMHDIYAARRVY